MSFTSINGNLTAYDVNVISRGFVFCGFADTCALVMSSETVIGLLNGKMHTAFEHVCTRVLSLK
jgi:hypothetical protein